jgi:hypothetical protein
MQSNHCSGHTDPSTSGIQARMFSSTVIYLVRRYRAARAKGRARIGRQRTGAHYNCAGLLVEPRIGGRMRRTFLRCSLQQRQPSLGWRRFDDLCDPSSCVHVRRPGAPWGPRATFTAAGLLMGACKEARWSRLCLAGCGAPSSARKLGQALVRPSVSV